MKYYEFGKNFEYYALIGASDINEATEIYTEHIFEDIDGELPEEITKEEALKKVLDAYDTEEEKQAMKEEFEIEAMKEEEPYLLLLDPDLDI